MSMVSTHLSLGTGRKKFDESTVIQPGQDNTPSAFIQAAVEQAPSSDKLSELSVILPSGVTISGVGHHNLNVVGQLVEILR